MNYTRAGKWMAGCAVLMGIAGVVLGNDIYRTNNKHTLNQTTAWVGGNVPGPTDTAIWDAFHEYWANSWTPELEFTFEGATP